MSSERRRARVQWAAIGTAVTFLVLAIVGMAYAASHFAQYHSGWREAIPELIQDIAWLPLLFATWWIKIRVEDWLTGN